MTPFSFFILLNFKTVSTILSASRKLLPIAMPTETGRRFDELVWHLAYVAPGTPAAPAREGNQVYVGRNRIENCFTGHSGRGFYGRCETDIVLTDLTCSFRRAYFLKLHDVGVRLDFTSPVQHFHLCMNE